MLGGGDADGTGKSLPEEQAGVDAALDALYEYERRKKFSYSANDRKGGSEGSNPAIARWLGDIRRYFPQAVVEVMQRDALSTPGLQKKMLLEPEILEAATPDVHLVATLLELKHLMPDHTRETGRAVVKKVVDQLLEKLRYSTTQAIKGALNKQMRRRKPRHGEIDWNATIRKNLKHYQPQYKSIVPEIMVGYGRKNRRALKDIVLCLDQSGSMAESVVYSGIFGAVLASLPGVRTQLIAFDTNVVDLTEHLQDPVELLFGVQLGGGTDIAYALTYAQKLIARPKETIFVLLSDLFEGGDAQQMLAHITTMKENGVQVVVLLSLSDEGAPAYDRMNAQALSQLEVPVFACTPEIFPEMMAAAIENRDLRQWAGEQNIALK